jgi:hypothetical protein
MSRINRMFHGKQQKAERESSKTPKPWRQNSLRLTAVPDRPHVQEHDKDPLCKSNEKKRLISLLANSSEYLAEVKYNCFSILTNFIYKRISAASSIAF